MDDIVAKLRARGIKPTRQRLEIARVLFSSAGHLSADRILALVNETRPATSKATVYNTLKLLLARGLIRAVIADPNKVFYDAIRAKHPEIKIVSTAGPQAEGDSFNYAWGRFATDTPAARDRLSSPPDTTSAPAPRRASVAITAWLELALTA